jgi:hypothetical protein
MQQVFGFSSRGAARCATAQAIDGNLNAELGESFAANWQKRSKEYSGQNNSLHAAYWCLV